MKGNKTEKSIFLVFFLVGLLLVGIGVVWIINSVKISDEAITTNATITEIDSYRDSDGDRHHSVYVSYEAEGKVYDNVRLGEYNSSMYEGKVIEVKYLKDNPGKPYSSLWMGPIMLMFMGAVFGAVGGFPLVAAIGNGKKQKKLMANGKCLQAKVESIDLNRSYKVNGRSPYILICTYGDEFADVIYRFKSGNIWRDPSISTPVGSIIDVYVDPQDYSKYYVDTEKDYGYGPQVIDFT